jgi:hypothetical protein
MCSYAGSTVLLPSMTDQLNNEFTPEAVPERALVQVEQSHRIRSFVAKTAIVACGAIGAATALFTQQPNTERTIGPVGVEAEVAYSPEVQVQGLTAAESMYNIGLDVEIEFPNPEEFPDISRRLSPIAQNITSGKDKATVLELIQREYSPEINDMKNELVIESLLWLGAGALIGSFMGAKAMERLGQDKHSLKFIAATTLVGALIVGGAEFRSLGGINTDDAAEKLSQELQQPFDKYLMTSTSKWLADLKGINEETRKQIERFVGIINTLSRYQPAVDDESQVWLVYSDSHLYPPAPETIETIGQAAKVDAITGLGDYGNMGNDLEMDLLGGFTRDQTEFIGFDDIKTCITWDSLLDMCKERGDRLPHGAISGNHDPGKIAALFDKLGIANLNKAKSFNGVSIFALADACFVDSEGCRGDNARIVNQEYAENQLEILKSSDEPVPKIGFFASYDASEVFIGELDTLIVGERHEFSHVTNDGSEIYYVPTVGQAFPRGAEEAGVLILTIKPDGTLLQCSNVSWQTLKVKTPSIASCDS